MTTSTTRFAVPDACPQGGTGSIIVEKQTNPQGSLESFTLPAMPAEPDRGGQMLSTTWAGQLQLDPRDRPGQMELTDIRLQ